MDIILQYPYIFLFFSLLVGGETILLPAIYLALTGHFNIAYVWLIMVVATVLSDTAWYYAGRGLRGGRSFIKINDRVQRHVDALKSVFEKHSMRILFLSKFVYGTRVAAQVLCGTHAVPYKKYFVVNLLGVLSLMAVYVVGIFAVIQIYGTFNVPHYKFQVLFALSVIVIVLFQLITTAVIKKKWFRQ